jgi:hypothetical protein
MYNTFVQTNVLDYSKHKNQRKYCNTGQIWENNTKIKIKTSMTNPIVNMFVWWCLTPLSTIFHLYIVAHSKHVLGAYLNQHLYLKFTDGIFIITNWINYYAIKWKTENITLSEQFKNITLSEQFKNITLSEQFKNLIKNSYKETNSIPVAHMYMTAHFTCLVQTG